LEVDVDDVMTLKPKRNKKQFNDSSINTDAIHFSLNQNRSAGI
jgi:hypothetical protein